MDYKDEYELILGVHNKKFKDSNFKVRYVDILEVKSLLKAMNKIDVVINLAANPNADSEFEDLVQPNLVGAYNVFECAAKSKVGRVIFASSIHAVKGYGHGYSVKGEDAPRPQNLYGATKAFGEALCFTFSSKYKMSCIAIRIGAYTSTDGMANVCMARTDFGYVISQRDMGQLLHKSIVAPKKLKYAILSGSSKNKDMHLEIKCTSKLVGYKPQDDASKLCEEYKLKLSSAGRIPKGHGNLPKASKKGVKK
jgi:NAD+ dependent glucose-6-phosphate dehydrogenase